MGEKRRTADVILPADCQCVNFEGLLLLPTVLEGLKRMGFVRPSPIQLEAIPVGRCGFDLIVQAKSGTGKTCVFSVIALESLNPSAHYPQVLVLAPTREIVMQIANVVRSMGQAMPSFNCCTFIGGLPIAEDKRKVNDCQIAVGTPGRIKQLMSERMLKTDALRLFVLDEADKLLEENFQNDINWIYHKLPSSKQILAFSATYPEALAQLLATYMQSPTFIRLNAKNPALYGIKQFYEKTPFHPLQSKAFENKVSHVSNLLASVPFGQCVIFSNYQMRAQGLCDRLTVLGWPATYICGKMTQIERLRAISKFKEFKCRVLVSTDLTARGIDMECVNLVVNLDVPYDVDTYLHRIGRAGRFGTYGIAVTFAAEGEEMQFLRGLEKKGSLEMAKLPDQLNADLWKSENSHLKLESLTLEKLGAGQLFSGITKVSTVDESIMSTRHGIALKHEECFETPAYGCPLSAGLNQHIQTVNTAEMENRALLRQMKYLHVGTNVQQANQVRDHDSEWEVTEMRSSVRDVALTNLSTTPVLEDYLKDLEPFLKVECCEKCSICSGGMSTELTETVYNATFSLTDDDRKAKEFLSFIHSEFLGHVKNECLLLAKSESRTEKFCTIIDACARIIVPSVVVVNTSQSFCGSGENQNCLLNGEMHSTARETEKNVLPGSMYYATEPSDLGIIPDEESPSDCNETIKSSNDGEITVTEVARYSRESASHKANEGVPTSESKWWCHWQKNASRVSSGLYTPVHSVHWHRFIRAQKYGVWLSEYMKFMVSRRAHP